MVVEINNVKKLKNEALTNKIPIMKDEGIKFLQTFIYKNKVKNILEIGTAVGYSAIMMASSSDEVFITTIERDEKRYMEALKNIKKFKLENRISIIYKDAKNVKLDDTYDLIFIDAAKGQNKNLFLQFEHNLKKDGSIITDNMYFHGLVNKKEETIESKNLRSLVRKIKEYHVFLKENKEYETEILEIGDGIAVSKRR